MLLLGEINALAVGGSVKNENFPADNREKRIMKQQGKPSPTLQRFNFILHVLDVERCHFNSS